MLARRFTIVCLLAALFGMFFASLAVQTNRAPRAWSAEARCGAANAFACFLPKRGL